MRANLWLRTASRVLVRFATFRASAFHELERRAKKLPWAEFVAPGGAIEFRVTTHKSRLYHSDAIAERLHAASDSAPSGETGNGDAQLFVVRVVRDEFVVSVDASGDLLHRRGYRAETGKAPLRETLAAALLLGSGWAADVALLDPFCGSGTIPIEAALIARRIAPGASRRFAFMRWPAYDEHLWADVLAAAAAQSLPRAPVPILGSDRDRGATAASIANAERAGVAGDVVFETRAISAIEPPAASGLLATNPPYGVRLGERRRLRDLYARLGQVVARHPGWAAAMYLSHDEFAATTGLPLRPLFRTSNGGIRVSAMYADARGRFLHDQAPAARP